MNLSSLSPFDFLCRSLMGRDSEINDLIICNNLENASTRITSDYSCHDFFLSLSLPIGKSIILFHSRNKHHHCHTSCKWNHWHNPLSMASLSTLASHSVRVAMWTTVKNIERKYVAALFISIGLTIVLWHNVLNQKRREGIQRERRGKIPISRFSFVWLLIPPPIDDRWAPIRVILRSCVFMCVRALRLMVVPNDADQQNLLSNKSKLIRKMGKFESRFDNLFKTKCACHTYFRDSTQHSPVLAHCCRSVIISLLSVFGSSCVRL